MVRRSAFDTHARVRPRESHSDRSACRASLSPRMTIPVQGNSPLRATGSTGSNHSVADGDELIVVNTRGAPSSEFRRNPSIFRLTSARASYGPLQSAFPSTGLFDRRQRGEQLRDSCLLAPRPPISSRSRDLSCLPSSSPRRITPQHWRSTFCVET